MKKELIDSTPVKQVTVLLAEDRASFRRTLRLLIESDGDIEVVGEAKNGREAVRLTKSLNPEIVVMDIAMPLFNGLQATQEIMKTSPATRVLILSANSDPAYIEQAMILGASGYLIKQTSTQFLAEAVREVLKGHSYFSTSISKQVRDQCQKVFRKCESLKKKMAHLAISDRAINRSGLIG
jgi:DNA-binding NarL/FixJ family response regulator